MGLEYTLQNEETSELTLGQLIQGDLFRFVDWKTSNEEEFGAVFLKIWGSYETKFISLITGSVWEFGEDSERQKEKVVRVKPKEPVIFVDDRG